MQRSRRQKTGADDAAFQAQAQVGRGHVHIRDIGAGAARKQAGAWRLAGDPRMLFTRQKCRNNSSLLGCSKARTGENPNISNQRWTLKGSASRSSRITGFTAGPNHCVARRNAMVSTSGAGLASRQSRQKVS